MAFIPVPNVAQVNIRSTLDGQRIENTLYFKHLSAWSGVELANLASLVRAWWTTGPRAQLSSGLVLREVYAVDLTSANGATATDAVTNDPGGPDTAFRVPNSVALCVSFRTAQRGRSYRGRNYVAGWTVDSVTGNTFNSTKANAIKDAYEDLLVGLNDGEYQWVIASRYANGQPRTTGVWSYVTAVTLVDLTVDSQRRRLPGRGA